MKIKRPNWKMSPEGEKRLREGRKNAIMPTGKNHYKWKGGLSNIKVNCLFCGKEFIAEQCKINRGLDKYCSRFCYGKDHSGKKSKFWKDGSALSPYGKEFNDRLREKIRERDNHKCQICGVPELECSRLLDVHHIDYNKMHNEENNLICLCKICHNKTQTNRNSWTDYFRNKISCNLKKGEVCIK